jgi:hypothetical protein
MTKQNLKPPTKLKAGDFYFSGTVKAVELRQVKQGDYFKRKPNAKGEFIRNHYNPKSKYGYPAIANYSCTSADDIGREIFLRPSTIVFVEV